MQAHTIPLQLWLLTNGNYGDTRWELCFNHSSNSHCNLIQWMASLYAVCFLHSLNLNSYISPWCPMHCCVIDLHTLGVHRREQQWTRCWSWKPVLRVKGAQGRKSWGCLEELWKGGIILYPMLYCIHYNVCMCVC